MAFERRLENILKCLQSLDLYLSIEKVFFLLFFYYYYLIFYFNVPQQDKTSVHPLTCLQ